jgi:hypothetical protein
LPEPPQTKQARHNALALFQTYSNIIVLDPDPWFLGTNHTVRYFNGRHLLYADSHHLNSYGAMELAPALEPFFKKLAPRAAP